MAGKTESSFQTMSHQHYNTTWQYTLAPQLFRFSYFAAFAAAACALTQLDADATNATTAHHAADRAWDALATCRL